MFSLVISFASQCGAASEKEPLSIFSFLLHKHKKIFDILPCDTLYKKQPPHLTAPPPDAFWVVSKSRDIGPWLYSVLSSVFKMDGHFLGTISWRTFWCYLHTPHWQRPFILFLRHVHITLLSCKNCSGFEDAAFPLGGDVWAAEGRTGRRRSKWSRADEELFGWRVDWVSCQRLAAFLSLFLFLLKY